LNFEKFLEKAGYEGEERDDAMKRFLSNNGQDSEVERKIIHEIDEKNEEGSLMRAGFRVVEN